jgi:hypothetical protein
MGKFKTINWWMVVVGIALTAAPFLLGFTAISAALWNSVIVGVAVILLAAASALTDSETAVKAMDWINATLGLWLVLSPFILGYATVTAALWTSIVAGVLILVLAAMASRTATAAFGHIAR